MADAWDDMGGVLLTLPECERQVTFWRTSTEKPALCIGGPRRQGKTALLREMTLQSKRAKEYQPVAYVDLQPGKSGVWSLETLLHAIASSLDLEPPSDAFIPPQALVDELQPGEPSASRVMDDLNFVLRAWSKELWDKRPAGLAETGDRHSALIVLDHFDQAVVASATAPVAGRGLNASVIEQLLLAISQDRTKVVVPIEWTLVLAHRFASLPVLINWFRSRRTDAERNQRESEIIRLSGVLERLSHSEDARFLGRESARRLAELLGAPQVSVDEIADYSGGWLYPLTRAVQESLVSGGFGDLEVDSLRDDMRRVLDQEVVRYFVASDNESFSKVIGPEDGDANRRRNSLLSRAVRFRSSDDEGNGSRTGKNESASSRSVGQAAANVVPQGFEPDVPLAPCISTILKGRRYLAVDVENVWRQCYPGRAAESLTIPERRRLWNAIVEFALEEKVLPEDLVLFVPSSNRLNDLLDPAWGHLDARLQARCPGGPFTPRARWPLIRGEGADDHMMMMWAQQTVDFDPSASIILLSDDKDGSSATRLGNSPFQVVIFASPVNAWSEGHRKKVDEMYGQVKRSRAMWLDDALSRYL